MKNILLNLSLRWLLAVVVYLLVCVQYLAVAQNSSSGNVPKAFATWNWEEIKYDQTGNIRKEYSNTWTANLSSGAITGLQLIDAPWAKPNSAPLQAINFSSDYRRVDGWELVKFDFGANKALPVPYFLLYQKTTGLLRIYAYLSASNYPNRLVIVW